MFKRILYPTDFSDVSKKVLAYIKQLKESGCERIILLHVIDERQIRAIESFVSEHSEKLTRDIIESVSQEMQSIEKELVQAGFQVESRIEKGNPLREILRVEEEEDISLIVVGSHGKTNLEEIFLGSVSEKVARRCKKPILIIKRSSHNK
jgi:nucleotide-binding universal stress UspA family protein